MCPDCGVPVQAYQPDTPPKEAPDPGANPQWTVVANAPNAIIGKLIKDQLEDAGIPVLIQRSFAHFTSSDYVPHELRVPRHMLDSARQLIDSIPGYQESRHEQEHEYYGYGADEDEDEYDLLWGARHRWGADQALGEANVAWAERREQWEEVGTEEMGAEKEYVGSDRWYDDRYQDQPSTWIRVVYGILLLVMSLPFILQLLQQLWYLLGGRP
jgi:hypothetical protein